MLHEPAEALVPHTFLHHHLESMVVERTEGSQLAEGLAPRAAVCAAVHV
jgi:hypothetical protein